MADPVRLNISCDTSRREGIAAIAVKGTGRRPVFLYGQAETNTHRLFFGANSSLLWETRMCNVLARASLKVTGKLPNIPVPVAVSFVTTVALYDESSGAVQEVPLLDYFADSQYWARTGRPICVKCRTFTVPKPVTAAKRSTPTFWPSRP